MRGRIHNIISAVAIALTNMLAAKYLADINISKMLNKNYFLKNIKVIQINNFKIYSKLILLLIVLLNQFQTGKSAACKGCSPPCICPGSKGEKVNIS